MLSVPAEQLIPVAVNHHPPASALVGHIALGILNIAGVSQAHAIVEHVLTGAPQRSQ